ncbi:MAG: Aldehyde dehydrogenase [Hydrocarboniphaga sp.]|uniref:aldehyde dehydrogenase family protein n=1 Tax=Hydrocarboniphaga sp. TaxID=2033016 RepID=UPI00262FE3A8|nr:aldehyde dehydrogenase family protein [Hydrocarboniphaga sp.]MDB5969952.1 Aldehyde dehydrogenase [Hydrocarboniphaga sp.]
MTDYTRFYIDGAWVIPFGDQQLGVVNPATEETIAQISLGNVADVDRAVAAARAAFPAWSETSIDERRQLLEKITALFGSRMQELALLVSDEMGAPITLASSHHAPGAWAHFKYAAEAMKTFVFEEQHGATLVRKEAVGVCAMITPWNWPATQITCKIAAALAAGCTMVLKPSEIAPLSAHWIADILHEAGVPAGVFNLVDGLGPEVGEALARHADVDMISITGSTRAGAAVAKAAADTIKRVTQELGGKSASIVLPEADFETAVTQTARNCFANSGQTCLAPTRLLVPHDRHEEAVAFAKALAESITVGDTKDPGTFMGPLASEMHFDKVQGLITKALGEGTRLVTGGAGKPAGLGQGYYVKPTVFAGVSNDMTIAREEVFGPVLSIIPYSDEEDAIRIANDSPYGLAGYVSGEPAHARRVAARLRTGYIVVNFNAFDMAAPFGGYKQSGNGREWGAHGFNEYLEIKSVIG